MLDKVNNVVFGWLVDWLLWEAGKEGNNEFSLGYVHSEMPTKQTGKKCLAINYSH